jgi:hypothetical protein
VMPVPARCARQNAGYKFQPDHWVRHRQSEMHIPARAAYDALQNRLHPRLSAMGEEASDPLAGSAT